MNSIKNRSFDLLKVLVSGLILGVVLAAFSPGEFLVGAWQSVLYCAILSALFLVSVRVIKPPKKIVAIAIFALILRIGVGVWLTTTLPANGFDTPVQNAGYAYSDAYERDQAAYAKAFPEKQEVATPATFAVVDQYGGMMTVSVVIYRLFSADVHRQLLINVLAAFSMGLGTIFIWKAINLGWGEKISLVAAIIFAFYPEGVILGSSQMREPLLTGLASITFWLTLLFIRGGRRTFILVAFGLLSLLMCWVSIPAGLAILMVEIGFVLTNRIALEKDQKQKKRQLIIFGLFLLAVCIAGWLWLKDTLYYDAYTTEAESGLITWLLSLVGPNWRFPFVLLYGLIQPVLPAAIVYQSLPVWQAIGIFRAAGWYFVIPFLFYGLGAVIKSVRKNRDWVLLWLVAMLFVWIFVSSARAGGDQWDNPRYRAIFLPWMALMVGWVWNRLSNRKTQWFWRVVLLEGVFIVIFTNWYFNRKFGTGIAISMEYLFIFYGLLMLVVIGGGLLVDHYKTQKITGYKRE